MTVPDILKNRLKLPVIGAPLFIVSNPDLVIAQCRAGIVGAFPSLNARGEGKLAEWLERLDRELTEDDAPYAVNLIVHRSNGRLEEDLELVVKHKVPIVITSLGARPEVNEAVHSYGGIVMHDIINQKFAHKAIEKGADGLICVAAGAGGHAGTVSPFALVTETREWFDGPIALSGSISSGSSILAATAAGADFAYVGSAFIATDEANAEERYKKMVVDSDADEIVYSNQFTGVHGNYLKGSIRNAGMDPDDLPEADPSKMDFGTGEGDEGGSKAKAWKDIWGAGQGVGAVKKIQPAGDLIAQFAREYEAARQRLLG